MTPTRRRLLALGLLLAGLPAAARAAPPVKAIASFSILADLVHAVGGDRVRVDVLVGPNSDAHVYSPAPGDARRIASADLVVVNGLGLEGWLDRLIQVSDARATIVVASRGIRPATETSPADAHAAMQDPHAWQDVANVKVYVANIRNGLTAADPAGKAIYTGAAARYLAELDRLDRDIRAGIATIPPVRRKIITNHSAFGYFGRAYGVSFVAPEGVSTDAEASPRDVARIIGQIRAERIPAVFLENISDNRLIGQIARETGARIGEPVYSDALSEPGGPAPTYIAMMRHNLAAFLRGLAPAQ